MAYYTGLHDTALKRRILQLMQELRSGTFSHNDVNTFLSPVGSTSNFSTEDSIPPSIVHSADTSVNLVARLILIALKIHQWTLNGTHVKISINLVGTQAMKPEIVNIKADLQKSTANAQMLANYNLTISTNPYMNGSKLIQEEQVCFICRNNGHVAVRSSMNCSQGARKLELIEAAIQRCLLFPNDRNVESNMGVRMDKAKGFEFVPDTMEPNVFHLNYYSYECAETTHIKGDVHLGGLEEVDTYVFGYEPAGPKRVRIDNDSEDDSHRIRHAAQANERERYERRERHIHQKDNK
ncbi:hypothetical protein OnM2_000004 [Erysiphe neolycopersici]|uniref:Uncharacterized protein n=1 Tax=Erysiphe neolycopersici TaxID=212602 RepID=A0A420I8N9_9PEZI|nr:hypothetical protein OnM2_000004 [Erysiphe neolycopersici]